MIELIGKSSFDLDIVSYLLNKVNITFKIMQVKSRFFKAANF